MSAAVAQRINEQMNGAAVILPMDGFHYSRAELQRMEESTDMSIHMTNYLQDEEHLGLLMPRVALMHLKKHDKTVKHLYQSTAE